MTRGRCGSLLHIRMTLSFTTPRRFNRRTRRISMSRKTGQIIARGDSRWLVRVYLWRDRETGKRAYHNRTIYGSLRHAQAYLTRRLHERDLSRGVAGLQISVDEYLDHWLKTAVKPKVRGKTYSG